MKTDIYQSEPGHKTDFPLPLFHAKSLNRYQGIIVASFFDSTMLMGKNAKRTSYLEVGNFNPLTAIRVNNPNRFVKLIPMWK